jgi:regulator of protease activity HflC (stomatin/prohibitin superfamily)
MMRVDTRVITLDVPAQDVIMLDNVMIKVNAVLYFMVVNLDWAIVKVMDYIRATLQLAQTTLRNGVGQVDLDTLLARREQLNERLQKIIDEQTEPWGVKVTIVEVKDVELSQSMQRAMAKQAEAEREKRAKIIHAAGEFEASKMLAQAADVIAKEPVTLQLRYLQTLTEIAVEKNSYFPAAGGYHQGLSRSSDGASSRQRRYAADPARATGFRQSPGRTAAAAAR